jgi:hypothetical protein
MGVPAEIFRHRTKGGYRLTLYYWRDELGYTSKAHVFKADVLVIHIVYLTFKNLMYIQIKQILQRNLSPLAAQNAPIAC